MGTAPLPCHPTHWAALGEQWVPVGALRLRDAPQIPLGLETLGVDRVLAPKQLA